MSAEIINLDNRRYWRAVARLHRQGPRALLEFLTCLEAEAADRGKDGELRQLVVDLSRAPAPSLGMPS
jgi:hypothetical protein